ncbi:uncharacterized protein PV09_08306 [Verruconis gallopava]|uniref:Uncharacterized protein n=1 Tax=Verruconis gallopava TaxID=253628 RepID=A0A0D2ALX2_9PEZI|nr:uncharacterized protein PV09_08306 [Verruconis gallopava]KIW00124.1 hypothetical protein PV09_08306 [Verruconis gallopava]
MPKSTTSLLPYELLALLRTPLAKPFISTRALQVLYIRSAKLISRRSQKFLLTAIPAVRRQLRWAVLIALLRTYFMFMRRVILDPRSGFERTINKHGGWMLLIALRERIKAKLRSREERKEGAQDFITPPTSPATSASSGASFASVPDYFLRSPTADPILLAVQQVIPDATGYKVVIPQPTSSDPDGQEDASHELARRISGKTVETRAFYQDGARTTPTTSESGRQKVVSLVIMEDLGETKTVKGAVTVATRSTNEVDTKTVEELGISFAEALAC